MPRYPTTTIGSFPQTHEVREARARHKAGKLSESHRLKLVTGHVRAGFRLVDQAVVVLGSHELFHRDLLPPGVKVPGTAAPARRLESRAIDSFLDLAEGDYVVHIAHGIARFRGMRMLDKVRNAEFGMRNEDEEEDPSSDSAFRIPHSAFGSPAPSLSRFRILHSAIIF